MRMYFIVVLDSFDKKASVFLPTKYFCKVLGSQSDAPESAPLRQAPASVTKKIRLSCKHSKRQTLQPIAITNSVQIPVFIDINFFCSSLMVRKNKLVCLSVTRFIGYSVRLQPTRVEHHMLLMSFKYQTSLKKACHRQTYKLILPRRQ